MKSPKPPQHDPAREVTQCSTGARRRHTIEGIPGLTLDVSVGGKRTWVLRYQTGHGKRRRLRYRRIGDAAVMGLAQAADRARQLRAKLGSGRGRKVTDLPVRGAATLTVAELADEFLLHHVRVKLRASTAQVYVHYLTRFVLPAIGDLRADDVRQRDIFAMLEAVSAGRWQQDGAAQRSARHAPPALRKTICAVVSAMYGWAQRRTLVESNPARGLSLRM
jgi:hypothetical protein